MKKIFTHILTLLLSTSTIFGQVEENKIYVSSESPITIELIGDHYYCDYNITGTYFFRYSDQEIDIKDYFTHRYINQWYFNLPPIPRTNNEKEDLIFIKFKVESTCPEASIGYISGTRIITDTPNYFYRTVVMSNEGEYYNSRLDSYRPIFDKIYTECFLDKNWRRTYKSNRNFHFIQLVTQEFSQSFVQDYSRRIECTIETNTAPNNEYTQVAYKSVNCKDLDIEYPLVFVPNLKQIMRDLFDQINFNGHLTKYWVSVYKIRTNLGDKRPFYLFKLEVK